MSFTKSTTTVNVHSTLGDYPAVDDGLTSTQLKERFDAPATGLKSDFNGLIDELEATTSAASLGAATIATGDASDANVQAKLNKIYTELTAVKAGGIDTGGIATASIANSAVTTAKIADSNVTTAKIADSNVTTAKIANSNVTTAKIADGAVTSDKLATAAKKAENITATAISEGDESDPNVQAKLESIAQELIEITQEGVADSSITTAKIVNSAVTTNKIADAAVTTAKIDNSAVTTGKIADNAVTEAKLVSNYGLVPKGLICMWSGDSVPTGWYLCDGQNGTPDLREKFILGASSLPLPAVKTGGSATHTITVNEMPSHTHDFYAYDGQHYGYTNTYLQAGSQGEVEITSGQAYLGSTGDLIGTTGGGQAFSTLPPYFILAFIMKG